MARLDTVQWIEDVPPSTSVHNDGSRAVINADYVQNSYGLKGSGVTIAEWDSGWIDPAHPDFAGRLTIKDSGCSEPNCTVSFHATHVGGTAVGSGSLSSGMYRGIAPLATLLSYEWPNSLSELTSEMSSAAASGAKISQNSWGWCIDPNDPACGSCGLHGDYDTFSGEYDRLVANLSLVTVFASGNEENDGDCPPYPYWQLTGPGATAKNTVTVGSVGSNDKAHSGFSSRGPTDDGRIKPDLVAAGCQTNGDLGINSTLPGATYGVLCGTSMAAPAVSGASALLIQKFQAEFGSAPRPATIKAIFVQTAADLGNKGPDYTFGFGLIDAKAAVDLINSDSGSRKRIIEGQIEHGKVKKVLVYLNGSEDVRFTVAWDDVPGSPVAAKQLVNDVFLQVLGPGGYQYRPWKLDPVNPGNPAVTSPSAFDDLNTVEQVEITKGAPPGYYTAWIQGASIPEGPQSYSLILPVENSGKTECGILPTSGCVVTQDTTFFPATYNLSSSIEILSDGVTLNMNGATFNGGVPLFTLAIRLDDKTGVTIKNGTIQKFFLGVQLKNSNDSLILNNTLRDNFYSGIGIYSSSNGNAIVNNSMINTVLNGGFGVSLGISSSANTITGNVFRMNGTGIFLSYSPNNLIFNNFFNSTKNAFDDSTNLWNTTKDCTKTNIVGGPCIGGNFWSDYAGKERDQDGLGGTNLPHNASGGIQSGGDFHPLLMPFAAKKCIIGGPCP